MGPTGSKYGYAVSTYLNPAAFAAAYLSVIVGSSENIMVRFAANLIDMLSVLKCRIHTPVKFLILKQTNFAIIEVVGSN